MRLKAPDKHHTVAPVKCRQGLPYGAVADQLEQFVLSALVATNKGAETERAATPARAHLRVTSKPAEHSDIAGLRCHSSPGRD